MVEEEVSLSVVMNEYNKWEWLQSFPSELSKLKIYNEFLQCYDEINMDDFNVASITETQKTNLTILQDIMRKDKFILSTSAKGKFVNSHADKEVAINCLIAFFQESDKQIEGMISALLYKKGLKREILAEKKRYDDLINSVRASKKKQETDFNEARDKLSSDQRQAQQLSLQLKSQCERLLSDTESQRKTVLDIEAIRNNLDSKFEFEVESKLSNAEKKYDDSIADLNNNFSLEKVSSKQKLDDFLDAYKNQMKLKAPVSYWEENKEFHKGKAMQFGIASIIIAPLIFLFITFIGWGVLASKEILWGKIGVIIFATSLAIWLIRILVRMYLSHNHLEMTSQERIIMTQSYLALISEGGRIFTRRKTISSSSYI
ncbi:MAG: hypothetical protein HRT38_17110 [Alteromonadaceae bacterium]|nr:hypothetical protein [Alteromonadaceae bacterium]